MKKRLFILSILFLISNYAFCQGIGIGISAPNASAASGIFLARSIELLYHSG